MKSIIVCPVLFVLLVPTVAFAGDVTELVNQLTQSLTEDIQRQRLRASRQDAEELRRAESPDLSSFGLPVERKNTRTDSQRHSVDCTTIDMGSGDSATHCD